MQHRSAGAGGRIETVHSLRGIAALAVALFHFTGTIAGLPGIVRAAGAKGRLGVEMFFVISGFIFPYSLHQAGYRLTTSNFGRLLWKRLVRLDPPYLATIAIVLLLDFLSSITPGYHGPPFHINPVQLGLHLGYLNAFWGLPWLNLVFWTLAIECQFYILAGLLYPIIAGRTWGLRLAGVLLLLAASAAFPQTFAVFRYLPIFVCGMVAFRWYCGIGSIREAALHLALSILALAMRMEPAVAVLSLTTVIVIVCAPAWSNAPLRFLGTVSYSLYLLHAPIGGRVMNLAERLSPSTLTAFASVLTAFVVSTCAAYALYRLIERPAQKYASSIRFVIPPQ
jgi:peptidoglycan/LPS O-acetylase OafA/YrhL